MVVLTLNVKTEILTNDENISTITFVDSITQKIHEMINVINIESTFMVYFA